MNWPKWTGVIACIVIIASCFMNWAYYPDLHKSFTGFDSLVRDSQTGRTMNFYGRQGIVMIPLAVICLIFHLLPFLWAKRINLPIAAIALAISIKNFILFSSAFSGEIPTRKIGLYLVLLGSVANMFGVLFVKMKVKD